MGEGVGVFVSLQTFAYLAVKLSHPLSTKTSACVCFGVFGLVL